MIERHGRRAGYGCCDAPPDPLVRVTIKLESTQIQERTDITGAALLDLDDGVATITGDGKGPVFIPCLRVAEGAKMPAYIRVRHPKLGEPFERRIATRLGSRI